MKDLEDIQLKQVLVQKIFCSINVHFSNKPFIKTEFKIA